MNNYRRLRGIIFLVLFLFVAALGAGRAQILSQDHARTLEQSRLIAANWASLLGEYTTRAFDTGDLLADVFMDEARERGGIAAMTGEPGHAFLAQFESRSPGHYFLVVDRRGAPIAVSNREQAPAGSLADRVWFRAHEQNGIEAYIGPSIFSRVSQEVLFTFTRRLTLLNGEFDGVFQMALRSNFFSSIELSAAIGRNAAFGLWRTDGALIGRTGLTQEDVQRNIVFPGLSRAVAQARSGHLTTVSPADGVERIVAYKLLPKWNLVVTASLPVEEALAPWRERWIDSLAYLALLALLAGAAGWWVAFLAGRIEASNANLVRLVARKENLLREMHHRVKNNLQIVTSLMRMSARRSRSKPFQALVGEMEERVGAMSIVFEMVYRSDLSGEVSLRDYLVRLVDGISTSYATEQQGIDISVVSEEFTLNADRLSVVGLLVTELVTNALKHAFPEQGRPQIQVRARQEGGHVVLLVADNGRGFDDSAATNSSLGMTMISAFVMQLEGEIAFSSAGGTQASVRFPLQGTFLPDSRFAAAAQ